jgi:hypothetical protein
MRCRTRIPTSARPRRLRESPELSPSKTRCHYHEGRADLLSVAKLYASDYGKRTVEKEGFVALLR